MPLALAFLLAGANHSSSLLPPGPALRVSGEASASRRVSDGGEVVLIRVPRSLDPYYRAEAKAGPNVLSIREGEIALLRFEMRTRSTSSETARGRIEGYIQSEGGTWQMERRFWASAGSDWTPYEIRFRATRLWAPGSLVAAFHLGQHRQEIEIRSLSWQLLGPSPRGGLAGSMRHTYEGRSLAASWRKEAAQRIDRYRKSPLAVQVRDRAGRPLPGADVQVEMTRHAYGFGSYLDTAALREDRDGAAYRKTLKANFNLVTVPMFDVDWGWSSPPNQTQWPALAEWAKREGIRRRGTNVLVPGWRWSPSTWRQHESDPKKLDEVITASIQTRFRAFSGAGFESVDAFSEPRANPEFAQIFSWKRLADWANLAKSILPAPQWTVNEDTVLEQGGHASGHVEALLSTVKTLRGAGAPINALALECRFGDEVTPPRDLWRILNRLDDAGLPILATELMVETPDEVLQADYIRDFMTLFFSHPATESLIHWGFWEGQHWNPQAALIRKDWSSKPAMKAYQSLVKKAWWTNAKGRTSPNGEWSTRGFHGDYRVKVTYKGRSAVTTLSLKPGGSRLVVELPL